MKKLLLFALASCLGVASHAATLMVDNSTRECSQAVNFTNAQLNGVPTASLVDDTSMAEAIAAAAPNYATAAQGVHADSAYADSPRWDGGATGLNAATGRTSLELGNVNNTSDMDKPVSTATQSALDLKADTDSLNSLDAGNITSGTLGTARLPASGVTPGTYGSSTAIPVFYVDAAGNITEATTAVVKGGHTIQDATTTFPARDYLKLSGFWGADSEAGNVTIMTPDTTAYAVEFDSSDLVDSVLTMTHNLNDSGALMPVVWDNTGELLGGATHTRRIDANTITFDFTSLVVEGTWTAGVIKAGGSGSGGGAASFADLSDDPYDNTALAAALDAKADVDSTGMTNPMTTAGDIIIGGVSGAPAALPVSTDGKVLTIVSGVPAWATGGGGLSLSSLTVSLAQYADTTLTCSSVLGIYGVDTASYDNPGGSGARTMYFAGGSQAEWPRAGTTYANLIDGSSVDFAINNGVAVSSSMFVSFDLGYSPLVITEATFTCSGASNGLWKMQGSGDNTNWTDLSANTDLVNNAVFDMSANVTAYRYYRMVGVSGNINNDYWQELTFKISTTPAIDKYTHWGIGQVLVTRDNATGSQMHTIKKLNAGTSSVVIEYVE